MLYQNGTIMMDSLFSYRDDYDNATNITDTCEYNPLEYLEVKFWLFAFFGTIICLFGTIGDCLLLNVLLKPVLKDTYLVYYAALTFIDIGILVTCFLVWIVHIIHDYFQSLSLYVFWLSCLPYFYPLSRLLTLSATYLIVACTIERYFEVVQLRYNKSVVSMNQKRRYCVIAGVLFACFLFRCPSIWEIQVLKYNCTGWTEFALDQTELAKNAAYQQISFWMSSIIQVFFPFIILTVLNVLITLTWSKVDTGKSHSFRSARKMMIAILTSYLVCNLLNLVITIWEVIDKPYLLEHKEFYSFATDTVFFLTAINSSVRLPIYYKCNHKIRREVKFMFENCFNRGLNRNQGNAVVSSGEGMSLVSTKDNNENGCETISFV